MSVSFAARVAGALVLTVALAAPAHAATGQSTCGWMMRGFNHVDDCGFERQTERYSPKMPWYAEGSGYKGMDIKKGCAFEGDNNAFVRTGDGRWNSWSQRTQGQLVRNKTYELTAWIRAQSNVGKGLLGVDLAGSSPAVSYAGTGHYQRVVLRFNSGSNTSATVFIGYESPGADSWIQIDEVELVAVS